MNTPICDFVKKYAERDMVRLHMPGHKGIPFLGCEQRDITEISGADELYDASGIIAESEENAARLFGSGKTVFGTEGSSQCIRAMLFLAMQQAGGNRLILAARNAHKAFLYACALLDLDVEWLLPEEGGSLCSCPLTPAGVAKRLAEMPQKPFALYLTAPDYLGYAPDIRGIAAVCEKAGVLLLLDNAHGAYLKFLQPSVHPLDLGAAMCCDSAHKTLPVLTGGAYLHLSQEWAAKAGAGAKNAMALFGSTSPSYLILQSLDNCNRYLSEGYPERLAQTIGRLERLKAGLLRQGWQFAQSDPLRLTILAGERGYSGAELAAILREKGVEAEFADTDAVVLMATPENREADFQRVERALCGLAARPARQPLPFPATLPPQRMRIREAIFGAWEELDIAKAIGRICASPCVSCPPAIPIAVSGEEITAELAAIFAAYGMEKIAVVKS